MSAPDLIKLAERVERLEATDNALDVQVEIALFKPDRAFTAVRPNDAGSKVIYTEADGREVTYRAADWTMHPKRTAAALRSIATQQEEMK